MTYLPLNTLDYKARNDHGYSLQRKPLNKDLQFSQNQIWKKTFLNTTYFVIHRNLAYRLIGFYIIQMTKKRMLY